MGERQLELALDLDPTDAAVLRGVSALARLKGTRIRTVVVSTVWHDTPDGALARDGKAVEERRAGPETSWCVARMRVPADVIWVPGTPCRQLAQAGDLASLRHVWPGPLLPVVAFDGTRATVRLASGDGAVSMMLEQGVVRAVAAERRVCRLVLRGPPELVLAAALASAQAVRASVPARSFAASAILLAKPAPAARRPEPPLLVGTLSVDDAFAHMVAHLTATMLTLAPAAAVRAGTEPVHQMRVAMRRLRSAMSLFQHTVGCAELGLARQELRGLATVLGPARDWDVFTEETAARLEAFADDKPVRRLLAHAQRRRTMCYADLRAYLGSAEFRVLGVRLAGLSSVRPWQAAEIKPPTPEAVPLEPPTLEAFAAHRLSKLRRKLLAAGEEVTHLPAPDLHALRIMAKRLRYAAEFFAPLFPDKSMARYIRRVSALQEALGILNDGAVTATLVAQLGRIPGYAAGVVAGDVAARTGDVRARIGVAWRKLHRMPSAWN